MGEYHNVTLDFKTKKVEKTDMEMHHSVRIKRVYEINDEEINKIKELIKENNLSAWNDIPINYIFRAMDAPVVNTTFVFEKGNVTLNSSSNIDSEALNVLNLISNSFTLNDDNKISEEGVNESLGVSFSSMGLGQFLNPEDNK